MSFLLSSLRWSWLLSIALFIPLSLPAGGAQKKLIQLRKGDQYNQYMSGDCCELRVSPFNNSSVLFKVPSGLTLHTLRYWKSDQGEDWIQVKISSFPFLDQIGFPRKGWVNFNSFV